MKKHTLLAAAALSLSVSAAFAETYTWDGGNGNWSEAKWNGGQAWTDYNDAVINSGTVTADQNVTTGNGGITLAGGTLAVGAKSGAVIGGGSITLKTNAQLVIRGNYASAINADISLAGGKIGMTYGNQAVMTGKFTGTGDLDMTLEQWSNLLTLKEAALGSDYTGDTRITNNSLKFTGQTSGAGFTPFGVGVGKTVYFSSIKSGQDGGASISFAPASNGAGAVYSIDKNWDLSSTGGGTVTIHNEDGKMHLTGAINISTNETSSVAFTTKWANKDIWLDGKISGDGNVIIADFAGDRGGAVRLTNDANDFTGTYKIGNASLYIDCVSKDLSRGQLVLEKNNAAATAKIEITKGGVLTVNTTNAVIAGLNGTDATGIVNASGSGTRTLTINNAEANSFAGSIEGTLAIVKTGAGTLVLSGTSNYSGATDVKNGALIFDGGELTGAGLVTVQAGATLGGTGSIAGDVTLQAGARLLFDAGDVLLVTGTITLNGDIDITVNNAIAGQVYKFFGDSADIDYNGFSITDTSGLGVWDSTTGTYTVIPEPSTYALIAGVVGLGAALAVRRRRRA